MMRLQSIRTRTVLVLLTIGILIVLVLGGFWIYATYDTMKKDISASDLQDARFLSTFVDSFMHDIAADEVVAASSPDMIESVNRNDTERLRHIGESLVPAMQYPDRLAILDRDGNVLYYSAGVNATGLMDYSRYGAALKANGTYVTGVYYSNGLGGYIFSISVPITDQGSVIGHVIASFRPEKINSAVQRQRITSDRTIIVLDKNGLVVSHNNNTYVETSTNISFVEAYQYLRNGTEGVIETRRTYDGQPRIVGFSPVPISGWGVIVTTPISVVYAQIFRSILEILALLLGLSLLIIPVSVFISRYLTRPIVELADNMRMIASGKYRARAKTGRKDEIGDLSRTFNTMMDELERNAELEHTVEVTKKYQLIFHHAKDPIVFFDMNGRILDANEAAEKAYGYPLGEIRKMTLADFRTPEEQPKIADTLKRCFDKGCIYETVHRRSDGSTFPVEISAAGTTIGDRPVVVSVVRDITEHKRSEAALRESEERVRGVNEELSAVIEVMTGATTTLDLSKLLDGILERLIKVMNANASVILLKENDLVRVYSSVGVEEEAKARFSVPIGKGFAGTIAKTKKPMYIEDAQVDPIVTSPIIKKKGIRSILGVPLLTDDTVIGVLHIDWMSIHPFSEREQQLLQVIANRCAFSILNAQLFEETRELQEQTQLYLDLMGHDINNLNQTIMGSLELISDEKNLTPAEKELIGRAITSTKSSAAIISNVRKLQQLSEEELHAEPVDLDRTISECIKETDRPKGKKVTIRYEPKAGMLVMGVPLLKEVFCNMINNSIKYSGADVTIDIIPGESVDMGKKYYSIVIEDNGMGIPDEVKSKLFRRFQRGTTKAHGKGLGLYIVRSLLEKFNGSVKVEDRVPGDYTKGAKFMVMLPAAEEHDI